MGRDISKDFVTRTGPSQSEKAFRVLLDRGDVNTIENQQFYQTIRTFFTELLLIDLSCHYAADVEDKLQLKDGLIANSIANYALLQIDIFTADERKKLLAWVSDPRFKILIASISYWQTGSDQLVANSWLKKLVNANAEFSTVESDDLMFLMQNLAIRIGSLTSSNFFTAGHCASDTLGALTSGITSKRARLDFYNGILEQRYLITKFYKLMRYGNPYQEAVVARGRQLYKGAYNLGQKCLADYTPDDIDNLIWLEADGNRRHWSDEDIRKIRKNLTEYIKLSKPFLLAYRKLSEFTENDINVLISSESTTNQPLLRKFFRDKTKSLIRPVRGNLDLRMRTIAAKKLIEYTHDDIEALLDLPFYDTRRILNDTQKNVIRNFLRNKQLPSEFPDEFVELLNKNIFDYTEADIDVSFRHVDERNVYYNVNLMKQFFSYKKNALQQHTDAYMQVELRFKNKQITQYSEEEIEELLSASPQKKVEWKLSNKEKDQIRALFKDHKEALIDSEETIAQLAHGFLHNNQIRVAHTIRHIVDQQVEARTSRDLPLRLYCNSSLVFFIYKHFFFGERDSLFYRSMLKDYAEDELTDYFKILLQTLDLLVNKNIPMNVEEKINDSFAGTYKETLREYLKRIPASTIKDLQLHLMALVDRCSTIDDCAKKLAAKFIAHNADYQALQKQKLDCTDEAASVRFSNEEERLRLEFFGNFSQQMEVNAALFRAQFHFEDEIRKHYNTYRQKINQAPYRAEIKALREALTEEPAEREAETRAKITEFDRVASQARDEYLQQEAELLKQASPDLYLRLYEKEIAQINQRHGVQLRIAQETPSEAQQAALQRQAEALKQARIEEAKKRFKYDIVRDPANTQASLVCCPPGVTFAVDADQAVQLSLTYIYDTENKRATQESGSLDRCIRRRSEHYAASLKAKELQDNGEIGPYLQSHAKFDGDVHKLYIEERGLRRQRHWKNARYVGLGLLAVGGLALLGLATVGTLGLIHLVWIIPTIYFAVGGGVLAGSVAGTVVNEPSRRQAIGRFFRKIAQAFRSREPEQLDAPVSPSTLQRSITPPEEEYALASQPQVEVEAPPRPVSPPKLCATPRHASSSSSSSDDDEQSRPIRRPSAVKEIDVGLVLAAKQRSAPDSDTDSLISAWQSADGGSAARLPRIKTDTDCGRVRDRPSSGPDLFTVRDHEKKAAQSQAAAMIIRPGSASSS